MNAYIDQAAQEWLLAVKSAQLGFKKLEEDYTPEALNAAAATILIHATKLQPHGSATNGNGHSNGSAASKPDLDHVTCDRCNGDVWDNRRNKRNPRGPDFKCKDESCAMAAWINKDGTLAWKE